MSKVQITATIDSELDLRIKAAAEHSDQTVSEWIEELARRRLDDSRREFYIGDAKVSMPPPGVEPQGSRNPITLRGGKTMAETVLEDRSNY